MVIVVLFIFIFRRMIVNGMLELFVYVRICFGGLFG